MKGGENLHQARVVLHDDDADPRNRLRVAAHHFWSAVFHLDSWPASLKSRAEVLTAKIFRYGTIDQAVCRMGDKTAAEISQDLIGLCDEAERETAAPS